MCFQIYSAFCILRMLKSMHITIYFNNELGLRTIKINNIVANWMLTTKLVTAYLTTTQFLP